MMPRKSADPAISSDSSAVKVGRRDWGKPWAALFASIYVEGKFHAMTLFYKYYISISCKLISK